MTDRPSFEAPIDPAAGVRPPTSEEAQRAAEVLADNIRGEQLATDGFLFVRADQAINAMLAYAAEQIVARPCARETAPGDYRLGLERAAHECEWMARGYAAYLMQPLLDAGKRIREIPDNPANEPHCQRKDGRLPAIEPGPAVHQAGEAWMSNPLSLDAGLPPTNQAGDADSLALIQRMANRESDPGGCLDIVSWLIEADRIAALAEDEAK